MNKEEKRKDEERLLSKICDLLNEQPHFSHDGGKILFVNDPEKFYERLLKLSADAKKRIVLSSLYIGSGTRERKLVETIQVAAAERGAQVRVLLDYTRGTRPPQSSCETLGALVNDESIDVQVHLYHTMALGGWLRWLVPARYNELLGLQHMKVYVFDDTVLISGANLSETYFTNRQDRCIEIAEHPRLADFYASLVDAIAQCSFRLKPSGELVLDRRCEEHPFKGDTRRFSAQLRANIQRVFDAYSSTELAASSNDTHIYPYVQYGHAHVNTELTFMRRLLEFKESALEITMASGYFNALVEYMERIANAGTYHFSVYAASAEANGFHEGAGISGSVPLLYNLAMKDFLRLSENVNDRIEAYEWRRDGCTYHAKGLWFSLAGREPFASIIGSSNFGYRSMERDIETGILLVTKNAGLKRRLAEERSHIRQHCTQMNESFRMLLQALVIGRALIESLEAAAHYATFRQHRGGRTYATTSEAFKRRKGTKVPWRMVYDDERRAQRLGGMCVREVSTKSPYFMPASREDDKLEKVHFDEADFKDVTWSPVYRFNRVELIGIISRVKTMQTIFTVGVCGVCGYYYSTGTIASALSAAVLVFTPIFATVVLYGVAMCASKVVGVASVSQCGNFVRVGRLTFWGRRENCIMPVEDIVPLSDTRQATTRLFMPLERYSDDQSSWLALMVGNCTVIDEKAFVRIFGDNEHTRALIENSRRGASNAKTKKEQ